jgi:hypothetical protein
MHGADNAAGHGQDEGMGSLVLSPPRVWDLFELLSGIFDYAVERVLTTSGLRNGPGPVYFCKDTLVHCAYKNKKTTFELYRTCHCLLCLVGADVLGI